MKKLTISIVAFTLFLTVALCACNTNNTADAGNDKVNIAVGYSLKQLSLGLDSNFLTQKEHSYQDTDINGTCTELYIKENGKEVSALYLQGFYTEDLNDREVMIGTQTFTSAELEANIIYQDNEIVVYDLSNYLYRDTLEARVGATGLGDALEDQLAQCMSQLDTLIVKGVSEEVPSTVQPQPLTVNEHVQL